MLFLTARQLLKYPFLLEDIVSFLARGEIFDLFNLEERHELNEVLKMGISFSDEKKNTLVKLHISYVFFFPDSTFIIIFCVRAAPASSPS